MKRLFYLRLAVTGIIKNKKTYIPYIITALGMVMMEYIVVYLTRDQGIAAMKGGRDIQSILGLGVWVIAFFSVIFLFYTHSFLMKQRKREFGLYNVLGMGKRNLAKILIWENLLIGGMAVAGGLAMGILFSRAGWMLMVWIMEGKMEVAFHVSVESCWVTACIYALLFVFLFLFSVRQLYRLNPVELLQSEHAGEKAPKANWVMAFLGVVCMFIAYRLALTINNPMEALLVFFLAVLLVIGGTYLLFIAGSVALCRLLQKWRAYYYRTNHFISVSSMAYRMKKNGAGLASICILCTMVLVMVSSTACLYMGKQDMLESRYPREIVLDTYSTREGDASKIRSIAQEVCSEYGQAQENVLHYRYLDIAAYMRQNCAVLSKEMLSESEKQDYSHYTQLFIVPLEDYNRIMGKQEVLESDEVILYATKENYRYDTFAFEGMEPMKVKSIAPRFVANGVDSMQVVGSIFVFVPDEKKLQEFFEIQEDIYEKNASFKHDYVGFDLQCSEEIQKEIYHEIRERIRTMQAEDENFSRVDVESKAVERATFFSLFGGMFFLGILLGGVFLAGAVMIIYYKQVTEGYEDRRRFDILQKVGMTQKEVKKTINSQVLTVFFLPLVTAGLHMAVAFHMVSLLLRAFGFTDIGFMMKVNLGSYGIFAIFYMAVYFATSKTYYHIVSPRREA